MERQERIKPFSPGNDNFRKSRVPPDKLVAMVTLDNLGNQK